MAISDFVDLRWNLNIYIFTDEDNNYFGSGYTFFSFTELYLKGENIKLFNFPEYSNLLYNIKSHDKYFIEKTSEIDFIWDKDIDKKNAFLNTMRGYDIVKTGTLIYNNKFLYCTYLDEKISGNISKLNKHWEKEIFIFSHDKSISILGIKYDDFISGQIVIGKKIYNIKNINQDIEKKVFDFEFYNSDLKDFKINYDILQRYNIYNLRNMPTQYIFSGTVTYDINEEEHTHKIFGAYEGFK